MYTTKIYWEIHDHCQSKCSYCPKRFWGGSIPVSIAEYLRVTKLLIDHYHSLGRTIEWSFNGGEPLELHGFPMILKLCKQHNGNITVNSSGGKLWLDWWAIEPNIDNVILTYHYWQRSNLIEFILDIFQKKGKSFNLLVPIRPDYFSEDIERFQRMKDRYGEKVNHNILYREASNISGIFPYSNDQLADLGRQDLIVQKDSYKKTTHLERLNISHNMNPSFTGSRCNEGIERLYIGAQGWVSGSICQNTNFGNIWNAEWVPPKEPSICNMISCIHSSDQEITKLL